MEVLNHELDEIFFLAENFNNATFGANDIDLGLANMQNLTFEQVLRDIFRNGEYFCDKCMHIVTKNINIEHLLKEPCKPSKQEVPKPVNGFNQDMDTMVKNQTALMNNISKFEMPKSLERIEKIIKNDSFNKLTSLLEELFSNEMFVHQKQQEKIIEEKLFVAMKDLKICQSNQNDYQRTVVELCNKVFTLKKNLSEFDSLKNKQYNLTRRMEKQNLEIKKWKFKYNTITERMVKLKGSLLEFVNEDQNYESDMYQKLSQLKSENVALKNLLRISEEAQKSIERKLDNDPGQGEHSDHILETLVVGPSTLYKEKVKEYLEDLKNKRCTQDQVDNVIDNIIKNSDDQNDPETKKYEQHYQFQAKMDMQGDSDDVSFLTKEVKSSTKSQDRAILSSSEANTPSF